MPESSQPSEPQGPAQTALPFPEIPGYRFQKRLGQGGMATVYLATQESLDRPVSIKVMERAALQDETSKQRFENEARTIARLGHSGIVGIHEVGRTADGQMYYVMPYLPNGDLAHRDLRNDEARIKDVLHTLLVTLGYAHSHGIVHRDVKEENVLFDAHDRPLLTDFGIALSKSDTSRLTSAGFSVGSSGYMAPEQARGQEVDGRADLYSVGVLTFDLLTGQLPFRASDPLALALMHAHDPVPRLPPEKSHWQEFIDRAMAKSPMQRYANAEQMLQALNRIDRDAGGGALTRARLLLDRLVEKVGGRKRLGILALAALLLLAAGVYFATQWFSAPGAPAATTSPQPPTAPTQAAVPVMTTPAIVAPTSVESTSEATSATAPTETTTLTGPEATPAKQPTKTEPVKPAPAKPATTRHQPVKKIKGWFSRLFHRR